MNLVIKRLVDASISPYIKKYLSAKKSGSSGRPESPSESLVVLGPEITNNIWLIK